MEPMSNGGAIIASAIEWDPSLGGGPPLGKGCEIYLGSGKYDSILWNYTGYGTKEDPSGGGPPVGKGCDNEATPMNLRANRTETITTSACCCDIEITHIACDISALLKSHTCIALEIKDSQNVPRITD